MNKRITIKDIARELNVHHSTVSRALRNDPRVNEKTRDLVLSYAREHEYQINMNAVQLRGTSNNAVALIVPNINHSFFADVISQLTDIAFQKGYVISVFQSNEKYEQEKEIINTIIKHNFAGVIVSIAKDSQKSDHFRLLKKFGIPLVFFDRVCEDIIAPKVIVNNYDITASVTEYLIKKGYSRIAHISGTNAINVFRNRKDGYQDTITKFNVDYNKSIEVKDDFSIGIGKRIFNELWSASEKPDAIISSSVNLTLGILVQASQLNVKIPEQLGLITFGSMMSNEIYQPQISTIEQQETEIAQTTFDLLEDIIENRNNESITKEIKAQVILRESC